MSSPVLTAPRLDKQFNVQASQAGAGAVLLQADEGGINRPISYFSWKFSSCQFNYSIIEKKALALI